MNVHEIQRLRGTNVNQNEKNFDCEQAKLYRQKCITEFNFDPLPNYQSWNKNPRMYIADHWYAKFKYTCEVLRKENVRNNLSIVGQPCAHSNKQ